MLSIAARPRRCSIIRRKVSEAALCSLRLSLCYYCHVCYSSILLEMTCASGREAITLQHRLRPVKSTTARAIRVDCAPLTRSSMLNCGDLKNDTPCTLMRLNYLAHIETPTHLSPSTSWKPRLASSCCMVRPALTTHRGPQHPELHRCESRSLESYSEGNGLKIFIHQERQALTRSYTRTELQWRCRRISTYALTLSRSLCP